MVLISCRIFIGWSVYVDQETHCATIMLYRRLFLVASPWQQPSLNLSHCTTQEHRLGATITEIAMIVSRCQSFVWDNRKSCSVFRALAQWSQTQFLEGHSSAQFSTNPNQTHQIQLIKVFRITRNFRADVSRSWLELNSAELWHSRNWVWDHCLSWSGNAFGSPMTNKRKWP